MRYTVIVPVYKAEAVLSRCIESILQQTVSDFELILINDGSPDQSGAICNAYAARDARIRVLHQENGGVSKARNAGLELVQGDYIVFVDSDDWVEVDYLEQFSADTADLMIAGHKYEGHKIVSPIICQYDRQRYSDINPSAIAVFFERGYLNYIWAKAFSASIVKQNHLRFDESINLSEDSLFAIEYAFICASIQLLEGTSYHYIKYDHETLTSGMLCSSATIGKLEVVYEKIHHAMCNHVDEVVSSLAIIKRLMPLYRNAAAQCVHDPECTWKFLKYLFSQCWFRKVLDYVDVFAADEDPKYRALLKTKSPVLFWLYIRFVHLKAKLHRSTTND